MQPLKAGGISALHNENEIPKITLKCKILKPKIHEHPLRSHNIWLAAKVAIY